MRTVWVVALDLAMIAVGGFLIVTNLGKGAEDAGRAAPSEVARALEPTGLPWDEQPARDSGVASAKEREEAAPPAKTRQHRPAEATAGARSRTGPEAGADGAASAKAMPATESAQGSEAGAPPVDAGSKVASEAEVQRLAGEISRVVGGNRAALTRCYQQAAKGHGPAKPLQGRIDVRLTVLPGGSAVNVRPVGNDTGSDTLASCLVALLQKWQFPGHSYEPIDFVWPFVFQPPKT